MNITYELCYNSQSPSPFADKHTHTYREREDRNEQVCWWLQFMRKGNCGVATIPVTKSLFLVMLLRHIADHNENDFVSCKHATLLFMYPVRKSNHSVIIFKIWDSAARTGWSSMTPHLRHTPPSTILQQQGVISSGVSLHTVQHYNQDSRVGRALQSLVDVQLSHFELRNTLVPQTGSLPAVFWERQRTV